MMHCYWIGSDSCDYDGDDDDDDDDHVHDYSAVAVLEDVRPEAGRRMPSSSPCNGHS